ncbi:hypothetical protein [Mycolicibacterium llatzerense]|uniref:hypothetical protein n=1 Tax=Mycolicibacterium llatzerense TaxID=280871 RepID=UPI0013A6D687|nr:hypothetical protein [Mycolicibacterium llatzerense]
MPAATNRTDRLVKALKESRPDFTLHNARIFARAVIDAPDGTYGAKPLVFLPRDPGALSAAVKTADAVVAELVDNRSEGMPASADGAPKLLLFDGRVVDFDAEAAEYQRLNAVDTAPVPIAAHDARPGDFVVRPEGMALYLGRDQVCTIGHAEAEKPAAARTAERSARPGERPTQLNQDRRDPVAPPRRPHVPDNQTRENAIKHWRQTEFALGADNGAPIAWRPAAASSLAVIGQTGSGKNSVIDSILEQARAAGWMTLHASHTPRDPLLTPGLIASTPPLQALRKNYDELNAYSEVIELARRIILGRSDPDQQKHWPAAGADESPLDIYNPQIPVLVALEGADTYLSEYKRQTDAAGLYSFDEMKAAEDVLRHGRDHRVHIVLDMQPSYVDPQLSDRWIRSVPAFVVASEMHGFVAQGLIGTREFQDDDLLHTPGQMTWIEKRIVSLPASKNRQLSSGSCNAITFDYKHFQAYSGGPDLAALPGQYSRLALDMTDAGTKNHTMTFSELAGQPHVLLDRQTDDGRWEPDPARTHCDAWASLR